MTKKAVTVQSWSPGTWERYRVNGGEIPQRIWPGFDRQGSQWNLAYVMAPICWEYTKKFRVVTFEERSFRSQVMIDSNNLLDMQLLESTPRTYMFGGIYPTLLLQLLYSCLPAAAEMFHTDWPTVFRELPSKILHIPDER